MHFPEVITIIAASAAAGKKIFLPGFIFSLLANFGLVSLPGEIAFLSGIWAVIILGALAAAEVTADFIPNVGSTMQSVKLFVAPVASALLAYCMLGEAETSVKIVIMLVSAACGEVVQVASTGISLASVQYTGGGGDPIVNIEEVLSATGMVLLAVFVPVAAAILVVLVIAGGAAGFFLYRRHKRCKAEKRKAYGESLQEEQKRLCAEINALGGAEPNTQVPPQEAAERLDTLKRKLEVNRQALYEFEAQSYFPVPAQYRKDGYLYAKSKRLQLVVMLLSVLPGLGHIYVGQWQKGLIMLGVSIGIDFFLTPFLMVLLGVLLFPVALLVPFMFRCIVFTDLEMIRQKLNGSVPVRPFEFF